MINVVFCHTPLHCLIAWLTFRTGRETLLIWISDSDIDPAFLKAISNSMGAELLVLGGSVQSRGVLGRLATRVRNLKVLRKTLRQQSVSHLLVFNDVAPEDQFVIARVHKSNAEIWLGEDGVAIYKTGGWFHYAFLEKVVAKLVYGLWWKPLPRIGSNQLISQLLATAPQIVREDVECHAAVSRLPPISPQQGDELFDLLNIDKALVGDSVLCILPLLTPENLLQVGRFLRGINVSDKKVLVKPHPRQSAYEFDKLKRIMEVESLTILPGNFPCELICASSEKPSLVVGFESSGLHIIKSLFPSVEVRSCNISSSCAESEAAWQSFYAHFGIEPLREVL